LNALIPRLAYDLGADAVWVPTDSSFAPADFDGVWLVPGSPYLDDDAVYAALAVVRVNKIPFLGTCGGLQYAVIEYLRNALGRPASHAESDGIDEHNAVASMACSLYGEERTVSPAPGSRFASWVERPFVGMHYCNYAPTAQAIRLLGDAGVMVGAVTEDGTAEVLEFPDHPFYVASLFQPHIGAASGQPIHPLVGAFVAAVSSRA
jgi:CTP synthase (UTP-ammonia lyase)